MLKQILGNFFLQVIRIFQKTTCSERKSLLWTNVLAISNGLTKNRE